MKTKLIFLSAIFSLLISIGLIAIQDTAMPVPLPVDGGITLVADKISNDKTYQILKSITKKDKIRLYKSYVNTKGQVDYYNLAHYIKGDVLSKVSASGMFYKSGNLSQHSLNELQSVGIAVKANQSYPSFIGGLLQFDGQLRLIVTIIILLLALTGIFIFDVKSMKTRMIRYSIGNNVVEIKDIVYPTLLIVLIGSAIAIGYAVTAGQGFRTFSTQLLIALVLTDIAILFMLMMLSLFVVNVMIRFEKPLNIIKNKIQGKSIFIIWILLISVLIVTVGMLSEQSQRHSSQLKKQIDNLDPWNQLKGWQKTQPFDIVSTSEDGRMVSADPSQKDVDLVKSLGDNNYLYILQSAAYVPKYIASKGGSGFSEQLVKGGVTNPNLNKKLWYFNNGAMYQQSRYSSQKYSYDTTKAVTIYIPKMYQEDRQSLVNTVYMEQLQFYHLSKSDIEVQVVNNKQVNFLYNEDATRFSGKEADQPNSYGSLESQVVVRLNDSILLAHNANTLANDILNTGGLLSPEAIKIINRQANNLTSNTVEPYQSVLLNIKSLNNQLLIANVLRFFMFCSVVISVISYINAIYKFELMTIVKKKLLGQAAIQIYSPYLLPLLAAIVIATLIVATLDNQLVLAGMTTGVLSMIMLLTTIIFDSRIRSRYTTILKGSDS